MNKKLRSFITFLWRAVIFGLGSMMIGVLLANVLEITRYQIDGYPENLIWIQAEQPTSTWPQYAFPLFASLYHRGIPLILQFAWQSVSFILAASGILLAVRLVNESKLSFWQRFFTAPVIVLLGCTSLLLQLRFYLSEVLIWLLPTVICGVTAFFVALHHRAELIAVKELNQLLKKEVPHVIDPGVKEAIRPIPHYNYFRGLNRTVSDVPTRAVYAMLIFAAALFAFAILGDPTYTLQYYFY